MRIRRDDSAGLAIPLKLPEEEPVVGVIRGWVEVSGPVTASHLAGTLGFDLDVVRPALERLEKEGLVLRGHFTGSMARMSFVTEGSWHGFTAPPLPGCGARLNPCRCPISFAFSFWWQHLATGSQLVTP